MPATWTVWAIGAGFGALAGLMMAMFGAPALMLSVAFLLLACVAARRVAVLSGAFMGIGGTWLVLTVRADLACEAFDAAPNQGCTGFAVEPFLAISAAVLGVGLLLGVLALARPTSPCGSTVSR